MQPAIVEWSQPTEEVWEMPLVLLAIVVFFIVTVAIWITWGLVRLALMLFMAGLVGWLADTLVPGRLPYGWLGAIAAGLLGSFIGTLLIGPWGPRIFNIHPIPALLGAIVLALIASLVAKSTADRKRP